MRRNRVKEYTGRRELLRGWEEAGGWRRAQGGEPGGELRVERAGAVLPHQAVLTMTLVETQVARGIDQHQAAA
jgi:hypothetical protein